MDVLLFLYQLRLWVWSLPPCVGNLLILVGVPCLFLAIVWIWPLGKVRDDG